MKYKDWKNYSEHMEKECALWLERKNVCTFLKKGKACGMYFKETASLILHYFKIHDLYACSSCYATYKTPKELEQHEHPEGLNVRKSE